MDARLPVGSAAVSFAANGFKSSFTHFTSLTKHYHPVRFLPK
jgi:hypothetical protein